MKKKIAAVIIILSFLLVAEVILIGFNGIIPSLVPDGTPERSEPAVSGIVEPETVRGDRSGDGTPERSEPAVSGIVEPETARGDKSGDGTESTDEGEQDITADGTGSTGDAISLIIEEGATVSERIATPEGFNRIALDEGSFGEYLRNLPLKPHGSSVRYYDGGIKPWDVHAAVIDLDVGTRDLQQCADAVIRLRAEYLYANGRYDQIHFNFTNGFNAEYSKWIQGYRISITGNKAVWVEKGGKGTDYGSFRKYLDTVFTYAGTLSLSHEMDKIDLNNMQPGDVFLKGGSPGHCVIITDMAENPQTGERAFLIAQSYMPAQDIHILKNPANEDGDPWYPAKFGDELATPEWTFSKDQIYRFAAD